MDSGFDPIVTSTHENPRLTTSEQYVHPIAGDTSAVPVDISCKTAVYPRKNVSSPYASLKYEDKG